MACSILQRLAVMFFLSHGSVAFLMMSVDGSVPPLVRVNSPCTEIPCFSSCTCVHHFSFSIRAIDYS
jgi:hypothetical protein